MLWKGTAFSLSHGKALEKEWYFPDVFCHSGYIKFLHNVVNECAVYNVLWTCRERTVKTVSCCNYFKKSCLATFIKSCFFCFFLLSHFCGEIKPCVCYQKANNTKSNSVCYHYCWWIKTYLFIIFVCFPPPLYSKVFSLCPSLLFHLSLRSPLFSILFLSFLRLNWINSDRNKNWKFYKLNFRTCTGKSLYYDCRV